MNNEGKREDSDIIEILQDTGRFLVTMCGDSKEFWVETRLYEEGPLVQTSRAQGEADGLERGILAKDFLAWRAKI